MVLRPNANYTLTQSSVPEQYMLLAGPVTLNLSTEGELTCAEEGVVSKDTDGYIVTLRNRQRAKLVIRNFGSDTDWYLAGAGFELTKDSDKVKEWISAGNGGTDVYLDLDATYVVKKTLSPADYEAVPPSEVTLSVDADGIITATGTADTEAEYAGGSLDADSGFDADAGILTFYDKNVKKLTALLTIEAVTDGAMGDLTKEFTYTVSGLEPEYEVLWTKSEKAASDGEYTELASEGNGTETADEDGKITFRLKHGQKIDLEIPANAELSVIERTDYYTAAFAAVKTGSDPAEAVDVTILLEGASGKDVNGALLIVEEDTTLTVTNTLENISATGVVLRFMPWFMMAVAAGALLFIFLKKRKAHN